jgi:hypothetical protein
VIGGRIKKFISDLKFRPFHISKDAFDVKDFNKRIEKPKCRWCHGDTRALWNNGVLGPGHAEGNYVCEDCGRVQ